MPQPNKIPLAFAASGDKNTIPENTETTGLASWREGFPAITSAPFSEGGIAPKRADFNGIFNALSQAVMWLQQGGVYAYDVNTDYEAGNVVLDAGGLYVANSANGPSSVVVQPSSDTTGATWKLVRLDLATQSAAGYMSAEDKTALDGVPATYLPLSGGTMTGEIKTEYISLAARTTADSELRISGGTGLSDGASVIVYGKDGANAGAFRLRAYNNHDLIGSSSGGLTWDGGNLVPVSALALSSQNTAVKYTNKLQILSKLFGATNGSSFSFDSPFAQIPCVILCQSNNLDGVMAPYDITTTGFKVYSSIPLSAYGYYFAIGQGV